MTMTIRLDADARSKVRRALKSHDGWKDYKAAQRLDIAGMTKDQLINAATALGIDLATITGQASQQASGDDMNDYSPKPRTVNPETATELFNRYALAALKMPLDKREKARAILETASTKQDGWLTERQFQAVSGMVREAEAKSEAHYEEDRSNEKTREAFKEAAEAAAKKAEPVTVTAPAAPTVSNDAAAQLGALIAQMAGASINPETVARIVDERITAALASIPTIKIECATPRAVTVTEGRHHPQFIHLLKCASARQPNGFAPNIWISGPTGSGKTHGALEVAKALALAFHTQGAMEMSYELLGFLDASGRYHRTPFREAFEHGGIILLDEIDSWTASVTLALNGGLANGGATFPDGYIKRHPDCIVIAAGNTWGGGATAEFVGRNKLDAAFLSRFPVRLSWDYDDELEQHICGNAKWAMRVQSIRAKARKCGLKVVIDPRQSIAGAALLAIGYNENEAANMTYLANLSADQRRMIEGA